MYPIETQDGLFHDGDGVSELGTIVPAWWLNQMQAELSAVLTAAGITPAKADQAQVLAAVRALISGQNLPVWGTYSATHRYQPGDLIKVDGNWYEAYHPDGCLGKDPRDPTNRPEAWGVTDVSQPYYWIKIGPWLSLPEVGSTIHLPTTKLREGLIKYRNDGNLHKDKFWRLAYLYPELVTNNLVAIADIRAMVIRTLDDGRGIDVNRKINSYQGDQIKNLWAILHDIHGGNYISGTGAARFSRNGPRPNMGNTSGDWNYGDMIIDASTQVPTGSEVTVKTIALQGAMRI